VDGLGRLSLRIGAVLLTTLMLQMELIARTTVFGVRGDIMLGVAVAAGLAAGPENGAIIGFIAGLCTDLLIETPFGLSALTYALIGYFAGGFRRAIVRTGPLTAPAIGVLASASGALAYAVLLELLGSQHVLNTNVIKIVLITGLINGVLAGPTLRALRWATGRFDGRMVR
jgi:rod shape-determining protein MreD